MAALDKHNQHLQFDGDICKFSISIDDDECKNVTKSSSASLPMRMTMVRSSGASAKSPLTRAHFNPPIHPARGACMTSWSSGRMDVGNACLKAKTEEKAHITAGPEFREREGHSLVIHKAFVIVRQQQSDSNECKPTFTEQLTMNSLAINAGTCNHTVSKLGCKL